MKQFAFILGILFTLGSAHAQPELLWSRAYGGGEQEQGLGLIQTADGGFALIGNEGSFGGGGTDGWIVVTDGDGEEVWSMNLGGNGYDRFCDVIELEDGFMIGGYQGSFGNGSFDFWLVRLDEDGNVVFSNAYGGNQHERCSRLEIIGDNNFIMLGTTYSFGAGDSDAWVVVTDEEGNMIWSQAYGGNMVESVHEIFPLGDDYMLVGRTNSIGEGGYDIWLIRIDNEGEIVWSQTYGERYNEQVTSAIRDNEGNFVVIGICDPDGGESSDIFLTKISEDGELIWSTVFEGDENERGFSLVQTEDNGYLLAGNTFVYDDQRAEVLIIKTSRDGEFIWSETYGGDLADVCRDMVRTDDGGFAIYGWSGSFGQGGWDSWLLRLSRIPYGVLEGLVNDIENDEPLAGAMVATTLGQAALTDEEGFWQIDFAIPGVFNIAASLHGYNDFTEEGMELEVDDTLEVNFQLTHPEFELSIEEVEELLGIDESTEIDFHANNAGNGPLTYITDRRLVGEANAESWELRNTYAVGQAVEDDDIYGVVFIDGQFYVSGEHDGEPSIYVFDLDGQLVETIPQVGEDIRGIRDLAWDGELIWGTEQDIVYGFTPEGELVTTFEGPFRPLTAITWDPDREVLWVASTTRGITALNVQGEEVGEVGRHDLRIYGLAYWANDPDGCPLYVFNKERETNRQTIHKINPDEDEAHWVAYLEPEAGGNPVGAFITNEYDIYSWVFMDIASASRNAGGDRIDIWQIDARKDWMAVDPDEGIIEAGAEQPFTLTLDAAGLPPEIFEGEIVFLHNAVDDEYRLPVRLLIAEGRVPIERTLELEIGWNMVSVNLQPDERDVVVLTQQLVDDGFLLMMKDGSGNFYNPEFGFNNIPGWFVEQGYLIKVNDRCELTLAGESVFPDDPIDLVEGWQIVSYYPRIPVDAMLAVSRIREQLLIAKDGDGNFYIPEFNFSNMGNMREGRGYQLKMEEAARLVYVWQEEEVAGIIHHSGRADIPACPGRVRRHFGAVTPTGANMSLLVMMGSPLSPPLTRGIDGNPPTASRAGSKEGAELAAFNQDGLLVGSGVFDSDGRCGIAIWGDDPGTKEIDGARTGDHLEIMLHDASGQYTVAFTSLEGNGQYTTDGLWVVSIDNQGSIPEEYGIVAVYPNPFNNSTRITYQLAEPSDVEIVLLDLSGRIMSRLMEGRISAGTHSVTVEGIDLASGMYVVQLKTAGFVSRQKLILVK